MTIKNSPPTRSTARHRTGIPESLGRSYPHRFSQNPIDLFMDDAGTGGEFGRLPHSLVASCLAHQQQFQKDMEDEDVTDSILTLSGLNKLQHKVS